MPSYLPGIAASSLIGSLLGVVTAIGAELGDTGDGVVDDPKPCEGLVDPFCRRGGGGGGVSGSDGELLCPSSLSMTAGSREGASVFM